jgi:hypothetical protein
VGDVGLGGGVADVQLARDLRVREPARHEPEDVVLARRALLERLRRRWARGPLTRMAAIAACSRAKSSHLDQLRFLPERLPAELPLPGRTGRPTTQCNAVSTTCPCRGHR